MATHNSGIARRRRSHGRTRLRAVLTITLLSVTLFTAGAAEAPAVRAERLYREARQRCQKEAESKEAAWQFARACFDWAEFSPNDTQRADLAQRGIDASRHAIERDGKLGPAHYYLALNLGQLARTKSLGALKLVGEMEVEFKRAIDLHGGFDHAGSHRSLGILYRDAPGWPASIGNRNKARLHLQKAVDLSPDFPENQISLLESQLKWGEKKTALAAIPAVEDVLAAARKELTGDEWAASWPDWDDRWLKLKKKASEDFKPLETPRTKK